MAAVEVTISGVLYDKLSRTTRPVVLIGEASLTGLGVGGGPIEGGPGSPPGIWGGGNEPFPTPPIHLPGGRPPGTWGGAGEPFPTPPIVIPPDQAPPSMKPPTPPPPGSPTTVVPPPAGSAGWPVQPVVVPEYLILNYPGVGPVVVAPPVTAQPKK